MTTALALNCSPCRVVTITAVSALSCTLFINSTKGDECMVGMSIEWRLMRSVWVVGMRE